MGKYWKDEKSTLTSTVKSIFPLVPYLNPNKSFIIVSSLEITLFSLLTVYKSDNTCN